MNDEIKISDEARECGEKEIQALLKAKEDEDIPVGANIQLLLNKRDEEIRELRKDKARMDWLDRYLDGKESLPNIELDERITFRQGVDAAMSKETKGEQQ